LLKTEDLQSRMTPPLKRIRVLNKDWQQEKEKTTNIDNEVHINIPSSIVNFSA
jgi:hypothetical protein